MSPLSFREAAEFVMPLGKYRGRTIGDVGDSDEGLKYLDWLVGQSWVNGPLKLAPKTYLSDPSIARELGELLED